MHGCSSISSCTWKHTLLTHRMRTPRTAFNSPSALSPPQGANLFERTVTALVRIAQGSLAHEPGATQTPLEEHAIRYEVRGTAG